MGFWHAIKVISQRKWMILGIVAATLLVITIAAPKPKMVYQATAFVTPTAQVMQGGVTTAANKAVTPGAPSDRNVVLSNLIILAQQPDVYDHARSFLEKPGDQQKKELAELMGRTPDDPDIPTCTNPDGTPVILETEPGHRLTPQDWPDVLEVAPVRNESVGESGTTTDIIRITIKMQNGEVAPCLANAVALAFAQSYQRKNRSETDKYRKFLEASKHEAKTKLDDLRARIAEYKKTHRVVAVSTETASAIDSIASLEAAKSTADSSVREAAAALNDVDSQLAVQPLVTNQTLPADMNPEVKKLQIELAQAEADLRLLAQRYKPAHETYKAAEARIAVLKDRIVKSGATYSSPVINEIHQALTKRRSEALYQLATARAKSASLAASIAQARAKISNLTQAEPTLAAMMTEYSQAEDNYKNLSQKYDQAGVAENEFSKNGSLVPSWSRYATGPFQQGPSRKALLIYGLVLSLVLGIVTAIWLESIDSRVRNAADVEQMLELPVIGLTPQLPGRDGSLPKLTHLYPLSAMAESYRILRTNILFALRDNPFKTLMVATGRPGQGATTTICNLAIALAQIGKRVILIDADMRRPSLHNFFGVPNDVGLSTLLQGHGSLTDAFQKTGIDNLIVLPAGPQPMNPSELLGSERMHELTGRLEEHCDLVLFDSPSTVVFSDGPMLASWVDAVLMVVSANQVPRGTEAQTRDLLRKAKANIIGVVVNRLAADNIDSCHFYASYYSDSVPKQSSAEGLPSSNGGNEHDTGGSAGKGAPKAIPAPTMKSAKAEAEKPGVETENDSPFPE